MGRGKAWTKEERERVAIAFIRASCDPIVGRNQRSDAFANRIHEEFIKGCSAAKLNGTYTERNVASILSFFRKAVSPDVAAFNKSLRLIHASKCTGCTEEDQLNMAVAIHCKATKGRDYNMKSFPSDEKWLNFRAWKVLQSLEKYKYHHNQFEELDDCFNGSPELSDGQDSFATSDGGKSNTDEGNMESSNGGGNNPSNGNVGDSGGSNPSNFNVGDSGGSNPSNVGFNFNVGDSGGSNSNVGYSPETRPRGSCSNESNMK